MAGGLATTEQINALSMGLTMTEVHTRLGDPREVRDPAGLREQSEQISKWTALMPPAPELDALWCYGHPVRKRLTFLLGFRAGILQIIWRETITSDRATELET